VTVRHLAIFSCLVAAASSAAALTPAEVYAKVAPSVWRVHTYDHDGLPLSEGSAVVVGPDALVTNCHVLRKAKRVAVRREKVRIDAKLELWDVQRDVCQLKAVGLGAPAAALGQASQIAVGQAVVAIGNPRGLELTMSSGLVSSIRRNDSGHVVLIQTSAAISGGSSGGGLFDDQGTLLGLTTLGSIGDAQNLNFAIPADWIRELPARHARLNAAASPATAAASTPSGTPPHAMPATPAALPSPANQNAAN
jgi:S1-C subfamily serine protease